MQETLRKILNNIGKRTELYRSPDGSSVLVLPYGGRMLGLFAPGDDTNFFWANPALQSEDTAKAFCNSSEWHNSGGDRTWLSPEIEFFFPEYPSLDNYWQQCELDPGNYQITSKDGALSLSNRLKASLFRSKGQAELEITKTILPALNPLRYESAWGSLSGVVYAGYTLHTSLKVLKNVSGGHARISLWNLLQLPHGGDLLVPTLTKVQPTVYFGEIDKDDINASDRLLRYSMRAEGGQKIGIRSVATPGRVGYLYQSGDQWALVVRNFFVNPSGEYVDPPWNDVEDTGYCIQACNVCTQLGSFSELEYHSPAIRADSGKTAYVDESQVWAYRGSRKDIIAAASMLVGRGQSSQYFG